MSLLNHIRTLFMISLGLIFLLSACLDESISSDPSDIITFSSDTIRFDTVFTSIGSATRSFRIINPNPQDIQIESLWLETDAASMFRLNVDGLSGERFENIRIPALDSIWVFAEVTVDPDQDLSVSPFVIEDYIKMTLNTKEYRVLLQAFGQNANYITPQSSKGKISLLSCDLGSITWNDPKPYVIFGVLVINECSLILPPGTRIYVHGGIVKENIDEQTIIRNDGIILVGPSGKILAQGTQDKPVTIQGDRLEQAFEDVPGQWGGILLNPGSRGNRLQYTTIKNSIVGILVDSTAQVDMDFCRIYNTAGSGLIGRYADINMDNSLIYNNNINSLRVVLGGNYRFRHCSFANYQNSEQAVVLANFVRLNDDEMTPVIKPLQVRFVNCAITGNNNDEIILADITEGQNSFFDYYFDHCALQIDELTDAALYADLLTDQCNNCIVIRRDDTLFRDIDRQDYHPDSLSILENRARYLPDLPTDLDGVWRSNEDSDIGCYEFVPSQ